jgi:hypothetical protein
MGEQEFLKTIFDIVEVVLKAELRNTSKRLILNYIDESGAVMPIEKARDAIFRYTGEEIPTLEEVRAKSKSGRLDQLDHLVLKMEYEAQRLGG